jgi:hypothetical protein
MTERITPRSEDFSQWHLDIIQHAPLADQAPVRGCIVFRPNGWALWEVVQREPDQRFRETGHRNAYFPMLIPQSACSRPTPSSEPRSFQARRSTPVTPQRITLTRPRPRRRPASAGPGCSNGCSISTWNIAPSVVAP